MSRNAKLCILVIAVAASLSASIGWCWKIRQTPDIRRATRKQTLKEFRAAKGDDVVDFLARTAKERFFRTWFDNSFPYMHVAWETRVPADFIAQMAEEAFLRFQGHGEPGSEDVPHIRQTIAFSNAFLPNCKSQDARDALRDRILDGYFLCGDYDGAIAMLEAGMPGHAPGWGKATVAKLRAHQAMENAAKPGIDAETAAKAKRIAAENFTIFGEYMLSKEMEEFEDCDPMTGIVYSAEWIAAKNFMRSSALLRETGDAATADSLAERAKKLYVPALKKAEEDKRSLDALKAEMKSYGL